jgi:hypothetical protein
VKQWIAIGKPASQERSICKKLDKLIFDLGKLDAPSVEAGVKYGNNAFQTFLGRADPKSN